MSHKIKIDTKDDAPVLKSELLQVADIVAREKGIDREEVIVAMEGAVLKTAQVKYGDDINIIACIDRKTGEISVFRHFDVVENVEDFNNQISLADAIKSDNSLSVGDVLKEKLPPLDFGRIAAQSARQTIIQKIKEAERVKQYSEFQNRIGEIITCTVKRIEFSEVIVEVGRVEGVLTKYDILQNEIFKPGDRVKVLLVSVNKDMNGPLLSLSRTANDFLKKLFEQEVPEVYDGAVKILAVARDPGSKAKIAVMSLDSTLDPIGACVGLKGSRVQAIVDELKGEKIDIIHWADTPAMFIVNSLSTSNVEVLRIVLDEEKKTAETVVPDEMLSVAIGRRGQNVRLASKLTGWNISVIANSEDIERRARENERLLDLFMSKLDVDKMVAHLLISEGYTSIDEISEVDVSELASIDGFDPDISSEIKNRASMVVLQELEKFRQLCKEKEVDEKLAESKLMKNYVLTMLIEAGIKTLNDIGDLSTDELLEMTCNAMSRAEAEQLIMRIRQTWFDRDSRD